MFCPICKAEYRPGFTICSDCHTQPVPDMPADQAKESHDMIDLYSPSNEMELAMIRSILDAESINYFVKNDNFGSMEIGPQIPLFNKKIILVQDDQHERASDLINDYLKSTAYSENEPKEEYSFFDKIRMAIEIILFGWLMPGKKNKPHNE